MSVNFEPREVARIGPALYSKLSQFKSKEEYLENVQIWKKAYAGVSQQQRSSKETLKSQQRGYCRAFDGWESSPVNDYYLSNVLPVLQNLRGTIKERREAKERATLLIALRKQLKVAANEQRLAQIEANSKVTPAAS